jgi:hypothetical protein
MECYFCGEMDHEGSQNCPLFTGKPIAKNEGNEVSMSTDWAPFHRVSDLDQIDNGQHFAIPLELQLN